MRSDADLDEEFTNCKTNDRGCVIYPKVAFIYRGQDYTPHRLAYEYYVGPIPKGMSVITACGTRTCVYPPHLELVPTQDLQKIKGKQVAAQRHQTMLHKRKYCDRGLHPFWEEGCEACIRDDERLRVGCKS